MSTDLRIPDTLTQTVEKAAPSVGAADPWDAPSFGAPVYLAYQAQPLALLSAQVAAPARVVATPTETVDAGAATPARATPNWLARLFGAGRGK